MPFQDQAPRYSLFIREIYRIYPTRTAREARTARIAAWEVAVLARKDNLRVLGGPRGVWLSPSCGGAISSRIRPPFLLISLR